MWRISLVIILFLMVFSAKAQVKMQKAEGGLLFMEKGKNVLFYQIENKSQEGKMERCNYIHPIWASDGTVLTEDFPADHLHHRGVFWAWHQVWIDDKQIGDPWEIKDFEQEVTDVEFVSKPSGVAILKTHVDWKSKQWKNQGKVVPYLREKAIIKIHPKVDNYQKIDFEIRLLALEENLRIGGSDDVKGYSGFSVRMVLPKDVSFTGPVGEIEPKNTAVKSTAYVNVSGNMLKGKTASLTPT